MKIPNILFYTLAVVFFFFAIVFVAFQNASMTGEEGGSQFWLIRTAFLLDAICLLVMFSSINRSYKGIHLVCILWMIIMPIIMYINHSPISDTVRTVLWPILFEATYLCCRNQTARCLGRTRRRTPTSCSRSVRLTALARRCRCPLDHS